LSVTLCCATALADWRGRRVGDVLDELRADGLTFIYSTRTVPADLRIEHEPQAHSGLRLAQDILSAHGLGLLRAAPDVYAVVPAPQPADAMLPAHDPADDAPRATIEEMVVQTSRYTVASENVSAPTFLTQQQVKDMPRLADETLRAVQRLPGTASNGFSSISSVRGGVPGETAIVLDGLRLYEPFHLKNFLSPVSLLDSRLIDSLEFYSGGFPVFYGDHMSSVIDATTVRPAQPRYYELGLNLFHASAMAAAQFADGRGSALLSARRSNVGDLSHLSENDFGEPHYWDAFGRADLKLGDATSATFELLTSSDSIEARKDSGTQRTHARYRNVYAWATLEHDWPQGGSSRLIGSFTDLTNDRHGEVDAPLRTGRVSDERLFHIVGLRLENELTARTIQHRFGGELRRLWGRYDYAIELDSQPQFPFPDSPGTQHMRHLQVDPDGYEASAYWDALIPLHERWTLQGGLRIDTQTYDGSHDGEQYGPRLSLLYDVSPQTHLRATWGRYSQSQGINELQVEDGIDHFLPAERAEHAIIGLDHSFANGLDLRIELYRKSYRRLNPRFENVFDPLVLFPEAEFDRIMIAPQSARAEGLDVMLRARPHGSLSGWLSYSWSRTEDHIDGHRVPRSWDQRHMINLGLVWTRGPWSATITNSFHTGWPTTYLQLSDPAAGEPHIVLDHRNRSRFRFYDSLDARLTRTFILPRGALDVFLEVNNATSRRNGCCVSYEVARNPDGSLSYARNVDSWLPLVPSAGVLWRY